MKKIIIFLSLCLSLFGFTSIKKLKFESGISIYGQVGFANLILEENFDTKNYKITATTYSTGIVKAVTKNRKDVFSSEGKIKDGIYIPKQFIKHTIKTDYEKITTYIFDYENDIAIKKKVIKKYETKNNFNPFKLKFVKTKKLVVEKSNENITLSDNDFLTLYLNLKHGNLRIGNINYIDQDDDDSIYLIKNNLFEVQKHYGDEKYKIILTDDKDSIFFAKAVARDIAFYGDAYIKKISEKNTISY